MPAKLKVLTRPVKWRVRVDDLDFLEALVGAGSVNTFVREDVIHRFVVALRAKREAAE